MVAAVYSIADLKHRVLVCTMRDVIINGDGISLAREGVYQCNAALVPSVKTLFNGSGDAIKQSRDVRTHKLIIRFRSDIDFTQAAWFYEQRLKSGARWFKSLGEGNYGEDGRFMEFDVRLVSRGDVAPPVEAATVASENAARPMPEGVKL